MGATILGWEFDADASPEARAAWSVYADLPDNLPGLSVGDTIQDAFIAGFDAKRSTEPVVVLPTEPGWYLTVGYEFPDVYQLNAGGHWYLGNECLTTENVIHDAGNTLTLLRPVAEVVAEVCDWMESANWSWGKLNPVLTNAVRAHFGVTS